MLKGIFFDAAGVLYTRQAHTADFAIDLLGRLGFSREISSADRERLEALHGQASQGLVSHDDYWQAFLSAHGVADPSLQKDLTKQIVDFSNDVLPVPGAREALAGLKQRGFLLGIVTDTMYPLEWKQRRLKKVGVAEFIDVIACSTVVGEHKPSPVMYLEAVRQAGLKPEEAAFVGHMQVELEGAQRAGMLTVAVNCDEAARADHVCQSMADLLNLEVFKSAG